MQKVELFKPEDFEGTYGHFQKEAHAKFAEIANKKLQEYLESCPVAYFKYLGGKPFNIGPELNKEDDTHVARLAFIEEISKEVCKQHIPKLQSKKQVSLPLTEDPYGAALLLGCSIVCSKCGVKLEAEWKEVK